MPSHEHFSTFFGFDRMEMVPLNTSVWPPLETRVIERNAQWAVTEDDLGGLVKSWTDREIGMSQHLRYPVRDRQCWEKLKERLKPDLPCRYRRQFGRSVLLMGNIDKRALREQSDKKAIEREVVSKVSELVADGGFSPMVDHNVPPDVPYEHFKYYMELLNELCTFS
jgi:hypothetical protein